MRYLAIVIAVLCACDEDAPDTAGVKATKAQCRAVLQHIVTISPEAKGQDAEAFARALPVEDIDGCVASEPEIRACMLSAADIAAVRKCIPTNQALDCMHRAANDKAAAHEKANKKDPDPVIDKPFDDARGRCLLPQPE